MKTRRSTAIVGLWALGVGVAMIAVRSATAAIIDVPDLGNGIQTIQDGIDAAASGVDEVVVAAGTYPEKINFNGKTIVVRSTNPCDPAVVAATIINGGDSGSVVTCTSGEGAGTALEGFTIIGGSGTEAHDFFSHGSGVFCQNSTLAVMHCVLAGDNTSDGGAMYFANSTARVEGCTISDHRAVSGGGIYILSGSAGIIDCRFVNNRGELEGGGGILSDDASLVVGSCEFIANRGTGFQGDGGGISLERGGTATIVSCLFDGNHAEFAGGGVSLGTGTAELVNSTLVNNTADGGGGVASLGSATIAVGNCILWANSAFSGGDQFFGPVAVTYSCVEGDWAGMGNTPSNPAFVNSGGGDFRLAAGSPCIDAGNNALLPPDTYDADNDGMTLEGYPIDLDGEDRVRDDPDTPDGGLGTPPIVDMGAYETGIVECPADLDGDDVVGEIDICILFGRWGSDGSLGGDINGDLTVDTDDFLALLIAWGPCF